MRNNLLVTILFLASISIILSKDLRITSSTSDGTIMGVMHKKYKIHGVQFHPESIKTKYGLKILENFVKE